MPSVGDVQVTQAAFPAGRRKKLISGHGRHVQRRRADNHLIGFGEWCALYLLNWNGRLEAAGSTGFDGCGPADLALLPSEAAKPGANPDTPVVLGPKPERARSKPFSPRCPRAAGVDRSAVRSGTESAG